MVIILVILTIVAFLALDYWVLHAEPARGLRLVQPATAAGELAQVPGDVFLAPGHTWLRLEPSGEVRLGSAELPLRALGGVDRLELALPGSEIRPGERLAALWRGERRIDLASPIAGTVTAVNSRLQTDPARLSHDLFGDGWLCAVRPRDVAAAVRRMFLGDDARAWLTREIGRLRDFLAGLAQRHEAPLPALLDGGLPLHGFAQELGEAEWRELVDGFFSAGVASEPRRD